MAQLHLLPIILFIIGLFILIPAVTFHFLKYNKNKQYKKTPCKLIKSVIRIRECSNYYYRGKICYKIIYTFQYDANPENCINPQIGTLMSSDYLSYDKAVSIYKNNYVVNNTYSLYYHTEICGHIAHSLKKDIVAYFFIILGTILSSFALFLGICGYCYSVRHGKHIAEEP